MNERQTAPPRTSTSRSSVHVVLQRAGVPYEVERQVCAGCSHILVERPVKRAAA